MPEHNFFVEGRDDLHSISKLLTRHGIVYSRDSDDPLFFNIKDCGSDEKVLETIETAVITSGGETIGYVIDADDDIDRRWKNVTKQLAKVDVVTPDSPPPEGFVGTSTKYQTTVGVWLMPDNQQSGKLENFLRTLIDEEDRLIGHAVLSTDAATTDHDARFPKKDRIKAIIRAWLAWQEEPGKPYGFAVMKHYFQKHDSPVAVAFINWFKRLYGIA